MPNCIQAKGATQTLLKKHFCFQDKRTTETPARIDSNESVGSEEPLDIYLIASKLKELGEKNR